VRGIGRLRKAVRSIRRTFRPGGIILMYHRVADLPADPYGLAVKPDHFAQHMDIVRRTCVPMPLEDLVDAVISGTLPRRSVAVTFDDGYVDNLTRAYPLLQAAGVPATVFVASGWVDSEREFWWDELERILLVGEDAPRELELHIDGREYGWVTETLEQRCEAHRSLHRLLSAQRTEERERAVDQIRIWATLPPIGRVGYRTLASEELARLSESGLVRIGGHTVTHPVLSLLSVQDQRREIIEGRSALEQILGRQVRTFAYPYGSAVDWTDATADIVRDVGFHGAVTTVPGSIESGDDPYRLRRWAVGDWDGSRFQRELESFFIL